MKIALAFLLMALVSFGEPFCIKGADVHKWIRVSGAAARLPSKEAFEVVAQEAYKTAFFQEKLSYDVRNIQQIEVSFMSRTPGYISFASMAVQEDGSTKGVGAPIQSIMPDGEYHT